MDTIRQRVPFKFTEAPEESALASILDEQEQDYVIQTIKMENDKANIYNEWILRAVVALSIILQIISFFQSHTPLAPLFPDTEPLPLIPLAGIFTLINISCLAYIGTSVPSPLHKSIPKLPRLPVLAPTVLPPLVSLLSGKDHPQTLWWTVAPLTIGLAWWMKKWIDDTVKGVEELTKLKYDVKGA